MESSLYKVSDQANLSIDLADLSFSSPLHQFEDEGEL